MVRTVRDAEKRGLDEAVSGNDMVPKVIGEERERWIVAGAEKIWNSQD